MPSRFSRWAWGSRRYLWATLGSTLLFAVALGAYVVAERRVEAANAQRARSFVLTEELRQSSTDLTRTVRSYVATGNPRYKAQYQEILDIRDGKAPRPVDTGEIYWDLVLEDGRRPGASGEPAALLDLMRAAGFTAEELASLERGKAASDALTRTEFAAMQLVEASTSTEARLRATGMLFDDAYQAAKAGILGPIRDASLSVRRRTAAEVDRAQAVANQLLLVVVLGALAAGLSAWRLVASIGRENRQLKKLATVFELSAWGMILVDAGTNRITDANAAFARMHGYEVGELLDTNVLDLSPPEERERAREQAALAARGESVSFDSEHLRRDGTRFPCNVRLTAYRDPLGRVIFQAATLEDITERKRIESDLRLRGLALDQIQDHVTIADRDGRVVYVNRAVIEHRKRSAAELLGRDVGTFEDAPGARVAEAEIVERTWREGSWRGRVASAGADGTSKVLDLRTTLVRDEKGEVVAFVGVGTDVTELERTERELDAQRQNLEREVELRTAQLSEAKRHAEDATAAKASFLANMSHEIRTPMNAVIGLAHLIRKEPLTPGQADRMDKLEAAAAHLLEIINAILDLSKIDAGKFVLEERPLRVEAIVANTVSMLAERAEAKDLRLTSEVDRLPRDLVGDPTRLQQALLNYANNAIKFTATGSVVIRAKIVVEESERTLVRFEVEDTGPGIDPAVVPRLFSAFEQADSSTTRTSGGTGLGLAITRRLAGLMGGEAGVRSEPGVGSTFWFTAWLRQQQPSAAARQPSAVADAAAVLRRDYAGARILVAEDNDVNAEVSKAILEDVGFVVDVAVDGAEAVAMAAREDYRLVLMDMQMPRMDGLEATREIRRQRPRGSLPIIAMTANAFTEDRERCRAAGMDDFVGKPVAPERLYAVLLEWLRAA